MVHVVGLGASLLAFWLLMSGIYTPLIISLGIASILLVLYIAHRMDLYDHETFPYHLKGRVFGYWGWLAKEIFKANIERRSTPQAGLSVLMVAVAFGVTSLY